MKFVLSFALLWFTGIAFAQPTQQSCVAAPQLVAVSSFLSNASLERLEIRTGRAGGWRLGMGTRTWGKAGMGATFKCAKASN
jgi:hypothetical protein